MTYRYLRDVSINTLGNGGLRAVFGLGKSDENGESDDGLHGERRGERS